MPSEQETERTTQDPSWILEVVQLLEVIEDYVDERDPYREPFDLSQMKYSLMAAHYWDERKILNNMEFEVETVGGVFEGTRLDSIPHIEYIILGLFGLLTWALFHISGWFA